MSNVREVSGPRPKAVVTAVQLPDVNDEAFASSLTELERLAKTLGLEVVGRVTQRRSALVNVSVLGEGKLRELAALTGGSGVVPSYSSKHAPDEDLEPFDPAAEQASAASERATVVIVDHDLSPNQMRNLERATSAEVLDRTCVILSIFQRHARTREARMQVEIAQLAYMAPRLRESNAGRDRQRGGIGGKGAGETALELDKPTHSRPHRGAAQRARASRARGRAAPHAPPSSRGQHSRARRLHERRQVFADARADRRFRVRRRSVVRDAWTPLCARCIPEVRPRILVSDTVGFIKKLPHDLVASFRSTLAEARDAELAAARDRRF